MAGAKFEYDEEGSTFYYFLVSFYALVIIPTTYYFWPNKRRSGDPSADTRKCHCEPCQQKFVKSRANEPQQHLKRKIIKTILVIGWIGFILLAYKVAHIQIEHKEYDPYAILGIDNGASVSEVKRAYRTLSRTMHPDKGGDPKAFVIIAKAYEALTNEEVRKNWEEHGSPDGPTATRFGIALPSWIIDENNSMFVLLAYVFAFMVVLPLSVGFWWYRSMRYGAEQVLMDTSQLYIYFIHKTPNMILKRALMILAASFEFEKGHNKDIVERPSDDIEVPRLMKELPHINEKNKDRPLCYPYSMKSRCLIHAHLARIALPKSTLDGDQDYILRKCPALVQEMVSTVGQLVAYAHSGRIQRMPSIDTMENIMKLLPMLVQAMWDNKNALLQLPHISEDVLRFCVTKSRHIRTCAQLAALSQEERTSLLRNLSSQQHRDILNVLTSMPRVTMEVFVEVQDDDDKTTVTAGALVTVRVELTRRPLLDMEAPLSAAEALEQGEPFLDEDGEEVVNNGEGGDNGGEADEPEKVKKRVWEKPKNKKKGGGGGQKKTKGKAFVKKVIAVKAEEKPEESAESTPKSTKKKRPENGNESGSNSETDEETDEEVADELARDLEAKKVDEDIMQAESEDLPFDDEMTRKERILESKSNLTHTVHCPYFPDNKQEWWWVYICDRRKKQLITSPKYVTTLKERERVELKFPAPPVTGTFQLQVCLRSDSYIDQDQTRDVKIQVHEARQITSHPQWDFDTDEDKRVDSDVSDGDSSGDDYTEDES